ncbi:hypothetical protein BJY04DRAFT_189255, partial [Aspergillus karnatakaensis]|uniref:uncharacterized protein n=1 Tax=Aspergillus karnatakaensis TaxID=1810916 RepID=UPI003CCDDD06
MAPLEPARPETDYERWLREQDEKYMPGDEPVYGPDQLGPSNHDQPPHGSFIYPGLEPESINYKKHAKTSALVGSVLLVIVILRAVKSFRNRRQQANGALLRAKTGEKSRKT